ncbi:alpha/beta fold hydrolase [Streptomyces luteogriseus]|uniref:alpha/beta fold hydrolase n=1 Tax=Streptomyces luteogriseus TaxID=68233 RepID=UPI0036E18517
MPLRLPARPRAAVLVLHGGGPVPDTLEALEALPALEALLRLAGPVPIVFVCHSMGGGAALRAAGHPQVRALLALACVHDTAAAVVARLLDPGARPDPLPPECHGTGEVPVP